MPKLSDGLTRWERYRLKDLEGYRAQKRDYAKRPHVREWRMIYMRKWRKKNRDKHNAWAREYHRKNRDKILKKSYWYHIKGKYGLTFEKWCSMMESQGRCCAICKRTNGRRRLHVDHDHDTGRIRGLLCAKCNGVLGVISEHNIRAIIKYLGMKI